MHKKTPFLLISCAMLLAACNAPSAQSTLVATASRIPTLVISEIATETTPTAIITNAAPDTRSYTSTTLGIAFEYPGSWVVSEDVSEAPNNLLLTSFDPASPPHKLEWDNKTVSIDIRQLPFETAPQDLDAWAESNRQEAIANLLEIFLDERLELGKQLPAERLRMVSGSGGIIDQVLTYIDERPYEINIQGNFDLAITVLDTLHASTTLKPADSQELVSGICGSMEGEIVEITITADGPAMPRCVQVTSGQRLRFINSRNVDVHGEFAQFAVSILPGEELLLDRPVGEYLAPGIHYFEGAEIYLVESPDKTPDPPTDNQ